MVVKLRLARHGRKNTPFYHLVAINASKRRDALPLEKLGEYDPIPRPPPPSSTLASAIANSFHLASRAPSAEELSVGKRGEKRVVWDVERVRYWLGVGAQPTESVVKLLERTGDLLEGDQAISMERKDQVKQGKETISPGSNCRSRQLELHLCVPGHWCRCGPVCSRQLGLEGRMSGSRGRSDAVSSANSSVNQRVAEGLRPTSRKVAQGGLSLGVSDVMVLTGPEWIGQDGGSPEIEETTSHLGVHTRTNRVLISSVFFLPFPPQPVPPSSSTPFQSTQAGVLEGEHKWRISPARRGKGKPKEKEAGADE